MLSLQGKQLLQLQQCWFRFWFRCHEDVWFSSNDKVGFGHRIGSIPMFLTIEGLAQIDLHLSSGVMVNSLIFIHKFRFFHLHFRIWTKKRRYKMWELTLIGLETTTQLLFIPLKWLKKIMSQFNNLGLVMLPLIQLNSMGLLLVD